MDDAQAQQTNPLFGIIPKEIFHTAGIAEQTCILGLSVPVVSGNECTAFLWDRERNPCG